MFSNRTLAVAAILALAIPAVGAAAPIVQPPVPEKLVEGHTVFTVITQYSNVGPLPVPDLDLNLTLDLNLSLDALLDLELFSNLTADLCIKLGIPPQVNGTVTDEEQANATAGAGGNADHEENVSVNGQPGGSGGSVPVGPTGTGGSTGPVTAPPAQPLPPRDETCTKPRRANTTTVVEEFAAAVAVLVREYNPNQQDKLFINATANVQAQLEANANINLDINETVTSTSDVCTDFGIFPCVRRGNNGAWSRFPGVLWFNDQYLVGPNSRVGTDDRDGQPFDAGFGPIGPGGGPGNLGGGTGPIGTGPLGGDVCADIAYQRPPGPGMAEVPCDPNMDAGNYYRYPCGGAVLAVREGMPDPRQVILNARNSGTAADGSYPGTSGGTSDDFAWIGLDGGTAAAGDETATLTGPGDAVTLANDALVDPTVVLDAQTYIDYVESYLITDPNDHSWVIDLYQARTQTFLPSASSSKQTFYIWAVNTLGTPVFVPDEGNLNCQPFEDVLSSVKVDADGDGVNEVDGAAANAAYESAAPCDQPGSPSTTSAGVAPKNANNGFVSAKDDPCAGYKEPSDGATAYCYGGQSAAGGCANRNDPTAPNYVPLRLYNALLYFQSEHLGALDSVRTHGTTSSDTNGCQTGTEWVCPGGDDDAEGNSHPFHPDTHPNNADAQPCPAGTTPPQQQTAFTDNAGGNHGGSATPTDTTVVSNNECDFTHAVWNVDIYFSANGRPLEPIVRLFAVIDTEGSDAAFSQTETPGHP